jgi:PAS domain S-box-containing protein
MIRKKEKQDFLENMMEGVISIDLEGNVTYMNRAALKISGYKRHEIIGQDMRVFMSDLNDYEYLKNKIFDYIPGGEKRFELEIIDKQGDKKLVSVNGIGVPDHKGDVSGYLAVVSDLTQIRKKEVALREYELSERTMELKQRFLSNMSHELLTPLNGICGVAGLLLKHDIHDDERELVKIIEQSSDQMLKIIRSIWNTLGLKEGVYKNQPKEFTLCEMLHQNINLFSASAKEKQLKINLYCSKTNQYLLLQMNLKSIR